MPHLKALRINDVYATAMARMKYFARSGKIYDNDIVGQAIYWKRKYNAGGKGTVDQYLDRWKRNVNVNLNIFYLY